jgi:hypothetical protein
MAKARPEKQKAERNQAIYAERKTGLSFVSIGHKWAISPTRARQIYEKIEFWRNFTDARG